MTNYHGWGRPGVKAALYVGELPGRKQPALYIEANATIRPLAYFKTEALAVEALDLIDTLILGSTAPDVAVVDAEGPRA